MIPPIRRWRAVRTLLASTAAALILAGCGDSEPNAAVDLDPAAAEGLRVAEQRNCTGCHTSDGAGSVGPTWAGLYESEVTLEDGSTVVADDDYLRRAIEDPGAQIVEGFPSSMPTQDLTGAEIDSVIDYIRDLSDAEAGS